MKLAKYEHLHLLQCNPKHNRKLFLMCQQPSIHCLWLFCSKPVWVRWREDYVIWKRRLMREVITRRKRSKPSKPLRKRGNCALVRKREGKKRNTREYAHEPVEVLIVSHWTCFKGLLRLPKKQMVMSLSNWITVYKYVNYQKSHETKLYPLTAQTASNKERSLINLFTNTSSNIGIFFSGGFGFLSGLKSLVGSKTLTRADIEPVLTKMRDHLISTFHRSLSFCTQYCTD